VCGDRAPQQWDAGLGGAVCGRCAERGAGPCSRAALEYLSSLALADLGDAGGVVGPEVRVRKETRSLLYGFAEYHLERRMKSVPMLVRTAT
jgi:DNA repair protein RecO (recombination protein O)